MQGAAAGLGIIRREMIQDTKLAEVSQGAGLILTNVVIAHVKMQSLEKPGDLSVVHTARQSGPGGGCRAPT